MGRKQVISFGFDGTLCLEDGTPNKVMMELVKKYAASGYKCYVVTSRTRTHESKRWIADHEPDRIRVKDFIKENNLPIKQCHFTNGFDKGPVLYQIQSIRHYDHQPEQLKSAKEHGIEALSSIGPNIELTLP